ncbi:MAG: transposase family protein [Coleofasciculaceae cyanobacterium]
MVNSPDISSIKPSLALQISVWSAETVSYIWEYLQRNRKEAKRLVGISYEQLIQLMEQAKLLHQQKLSEKERSKTRLISAGGGKKPQLEEEEQIILTLIYLRHHLSFQILGLLFQVSESTAHNIFSYWQGLLRESLPASLLEQIKKCQIKNPQTEN